MRAARPDTPLTMSTERGMPLLTMQVMVIPMIRVMAMVMGGEGITRT